MRINVSVITAVIGTAVTVALVFGVNAQTTTSPYYSEGAVIAPLPVAGVPPLPEWRLQPIGKRPVMGSVNTGPGLDGPNVYDLSARGYVEEEYFIEGHGNVYAADGTGVVEADVPYVSRILVRRPANKNAFSGNIIIEPSRDVNEWTTTWPAAAPRMIDHGDVFVALTMAKANLADFFFGYDADRYGSLSIPHEGLRWDLMAQVGALMRSSEGPLGELGFLDHAKTLKGGLKVISTGTSLTGGMQSTFIDDGHHARARRADGGPVMDGYLILVSGRPQNLPADAAVISIVAEGDFGRSAERLKALRTPDQDGPVRFRWYEMAGVSHANWGDQSQFTPAFQLIGAKERTTIRCAAPVSDVAVKNDFVTAALANLEAWIREGSTPPPGRMLTLDVNNEVKRDTHGNAVGGLRPYWVEVPISRVFPVSEEVPESAAIAATGGLCGMFAYEAPLPNSVLHQMYEDSADYLSKVEGHLKTLVAARYLLPEDAERQLQRARLNRIP
mgnify:FL=1